MEIPEILIPVSSVFKTYFMLMKTPILSINPSEKKEEKKNLVSRRLAGMTLGNRFITTSRDETSLHTRRGQNEPSLFSHDKGTEKTNRDLGGGEK